MSAYYDKRTKNWYCVFYFTDWKGTKKQKKKRGFSRKKDALEYEREFHDKLPSSPDMAFSDMVELYLADKKMHTKLKTYKTKKSRIYTWILPYFNDKDINAITAVDIRQWQGELKGAIGATGELLSPAYMQNLITEFSGIFNFAVRFYNLPTNPCKVAGNLVGKKGKSLDFWTREEFDRFIDTFDKADPYYAAFMTLYYTGMRIGDDDDKIRLNQRKPSKYKGLRRFGPEKNLQRINKFMKERPIFYKNLIQMKENFRFYLRCFYCITKVVILQFNSENRTELARNG